MPEMAGEIEIVRTEAVGVYKSAVSGNGVYPPVIRLDITELPPHLPLSHGYHPSVFIPRSCAVSWPCFRGIQVYLVIRSTSSGQQTAAGNSCAVDRTASTDAQWRVPCWTTVAGRDLVTSHQPSQVREDHCAVN
jgi:hypothetical protein